MKKNATHYIPKARRVLTLGHSTCGLVLGYSDKFSNRRAAVTCGRCKKTTEF